MKEIYKSSNSTLYIAKYQDFDNDVIIKTGSSSFQTDEQKQRIVNEYEYLKNGIAGTRKALKLIKENNQVSVMLEYIEGQKLKQFINRV